MFDGRHCTKEDLVQLIKETNRIKLFISQRDEDLDRLIKRYLSFIERFDADIASRMSREISSVSGDCDKTTDIINKNVELLEQNVLVDINEHNS